MFQPCSIFVAVSSQDLILCDMCWNVSISKTVFFIDISLLGGQRNQPQSYKKFYPSLKTWNLLPTFISFQNLAGKILAQPITKLGKPEQRTNPPTSQGGLAIPADSTIQTTSFKLSPVLPNIKGIFSPSPSILVTSREWQKNQVSWSAQNGASTQKLTFWSRGPLRAGTFRSWPGEGGQGTLLAMLQWAPHFTTARRSRARRKD